MQVYILFYLVSLNIFELFLACSIFFNMIDSCPVPTLIPFLSLWYVINIRQGEYEDIFYTIMVTNWIMGIVVLTFIPFFLKRELKTTFKELFVF